MEALGVGIVAVVLALGVATPAEARGMTWDFAALVAHDYWQQRGVAVPCEPTSYLLTAAEDREVQASFAVTVDMLADVQGCRVLVTPGVEWQRTNGGAYDYCVGVVHEIGHLAGLDHDYGGVMSAASGVGPFGCAFPRQWAVKQGWRKPPRWVRRSPSRVERLWLAGRVWRAQVVRARWLRRA